MNAKEKPARTFWGRVKWALKHPWGYQRAMLMEESRKKRKFWDECERLAKATGRDYEKELRDRIEEERKHPSDFKRRNSTFLGL